MSDSFEILMLIREIYAKSISKIEASLSGSGLTHQQIMVLKFVAHNGEINISQLCKEMYLSKGTISGIVNRLEQADYIKKIKYENDKRNTYIQFSDKGLEFKKDFRVNIEEAFDNLFNDFTKEEREDIIKSLNLIKDKIK
jgi:DNA-binding MarR family transcriptional regulator